MNRIIVNAAKCLVCGDIIESVSHYDFKTCSCGNLSVDGGHEYIKRSWKDISKVIELSVTVDEDSTEC